MEAACQSPEERLFQRSHPFLSTHLHTLASQTLLHQPPLWGNEAWVLLFFPKEMCDPLRDQNQGRVEALLSHQRLG